MSLTLGSECMGDAQWHENSLLCVIRAYFCNCKFWETLMSCMLWRMARFWSSRCFWWTKNESYFGIWMYWWCSVAWELVALCYKSLFLQLQILRNTHELYVMKNNAFFKAVVVFCGQKISLTFGFECMGDALWRESV